MSEQGQAAGELRVQISGTFEMRDKDGNLIKSVPFTGTAPLEQAEQEKEDDNLGE